MGETGQTGANDRENAKPRNTTEKKNFLQNLVRD